ncbi:hypothetical protein N7509_003120 [Penicillium cosmopolitanum]|uniref:Uncharacterized protein n=1 Tax=Penicillium cosmopolitanum TaxID=1131564 RepID=A0A9W9W4B4_9EURO|nr:uncharacterized protein N7509_003120 [Penicillium cosmopolitanum]KAJ5403249.1 hypothetical protein N7509_003120 [Penicillium cosmopolitanum]
MAAAKGNSKELDFETLEQNGKKSPAWQVDNRKKKETPPTTLQSWQTYQLQRNTLSTKNQT